MRRHAFECGSGEGQQKPSLLRQVHPNERNPESRYGKAQTYGNDAQEHCVLNHYAPSFVEDSVRRNVRVILSSHLFYSVKTQMSLREIDLTRGRPTCRVHCLSHA